MQALSHELHVWMWQAACISMAAGSCKLLLPHRKHTPAGPSSACLCLYGYSCIEMHMMPYCCAVGLQIFEGIRDFIVQSVELKFNCFFLMPLVDTFPQV